VQSLVVRLDCRSLDCRYIWPYELCVQPLCPCHPLED
jgi:hypothetical protein